VTPTADPHASSIKHCIPLGLGLSAATSGRSANVQDVVVMVIDGVSRERPRLSTFAITAKLNYLVAKN
jgi:hypothetical protein